MKWIKLIVSLLLLGICTNVVIAYLLDDTESETVYPAYTKISASLFLIAAFLVIAVVILILFGAAVDEIRYE